MSRPVCLVPLVSQPFSDPYQANPDDYQPATIRLYHDRERPSHLRVGVLK
ncbi:MAG: hypothetical protein WBA12_00560 [Catalinimonas sp.]